MEWYICLWLLSLRITISRFIHVFLFFFFLFFLLSSIPLHRCITICLSIHLWWMFGFLLVWGYCEDDCPEYSYSSVCMNVCFTFSWVIPMNGMARLYGRGVFNLFFFFLFFLRATLAAYGSSQANGWIWATAAAYTTARGNSGSLTHCVKPGITPASLWILVGLITTEPRQELLNLLRYILWELRTPLVYLGSDKDTKSRSSRCGSVVNESD